MNALYNPDMSPKGSEGSSYALTPNVRIADLMEEIEREPELADPRQQRPGRAQAQDRLDQAALVEQVLFEDSLDDDRLRFARRQLHDDLWLYAWPVLKAFIRTARMNQLLRRYDPSRFVAVRPEDQVVLRSSEEERDALAIDVIGRAIKDFDRTAIAGRKWSPTGGASLRTYFIGTCALNFQRAYKKWSKSRGNKLDRVARKHNIDLERVAEDVAALTPDLATHAAQRIAVSELIKMAQPQTKVILGLIMQDLTFVQIAAVLGLTTGAVEQRMRRFRHRVARERRHAGLIYVWESQTSIGGAL